MRIAVLETGAPPTEEMRRRNPRYAAMFERLLAPVLPRASFTPVSVVDGAAPPPVSEVDGVLVTGSPAGVYENHAWIAPLEDYVRRAAAARTPSVGICFGHQLFAQAFGGRVAKSDKGWGVGVHTYDVAAEAAWMQPSARKISCVVSHQDQVLDRPAGARVLAGSDFCPNGALAYAQGPAVSFQMHPEFDHDFAAALLSVRARSMPGDTVATARASYAAASDRAVIARWMARFFETGGERA
ncbi:MAG: type 1 glutamine amidotransferase [Pseudomonadota bacterium]